MWFIDVIGDKRRIDKKGVLLSSELWDFSPIYTRAIRAVNAGTFGKTYVLDAKNGLSLLKTNKAPASAWAKVAAAQRESPTARSRSSRPRPSRQSRGTARPS